VTEARKARRRGTALVASVVVAHQIANARTSQTAIGEMLAEQDIVSPAEALLNLTAFTTDPPNVEKMLAEIDREATETLGRLQVPEFDASFDRLVASLVQDAGRTAESVATAIRRDIYHVRHVSLPCCSRCAVLAGRVYRWSSGFERHENCDCSMIPTTISSPYRMDIDEAVRAGQVSGLSKADMQALADGANLNKVVNVRLKSAGLHQAGRAITRAGRPTPEGIYRLAGDDRAKAVEMLKEFRYIL
jgi:hypothetical protein